MRLLLSVSLAFAAVAVSAGNIERIDALISRGNQAYELSQPSDIKQCADSASMLLAVGNFVLNDSIDLQASVYKLYGNYHYEISSLDSAQIYYGKAQNVVDSHPDVSFKSLTKLLLLRDRAQLHYLRGDYEAAAGLMAAADEEIEYHTPYLVGGDDWLITKLTYAICLARVGDFDNAIDIAETELAGAIDKNSLSYAKAERMYAKILMLADANKAGALKAYKSYFDKQKAFALENFGRMDTRQRSEYWSTLQPFIADCYRLEDADAGFLYDVALFAKGLLLQLDRLSGPGKATDAALSTLSYRWPDIRKRLKPGQCAVEFIEYEKNGLKQMAAIVLKPTGKPQFVSLTPPDEVMAVAGSAMQSNERTTKDWLYENPALHRIVWTENLLKSFAGSKRIYFAPDGYLHRLAIEYMPPVADYELYRLTSTRRLMEQSSSLSPAAPMLLVGGINYDLDKDPGGDDMQNDSIAYFRYTATRFPRLSDASNEARSIYNMRCNPVDTFVTASKASENALRRLAPEYESILVSTHGDFCATAPVSTDIKGIAPERTMSQNIIALAGVNDYLQEKGFDPNSHYDGLLSAKEISQIDLSRCRLFTASSCQSGLGSISADGVFGLQRGLKNAGVEVMLLSLWNVSSDAAALLMKHFYTKLGEGESMRKAFTYARNRLLSDSTTDAAVATEYQFDPATMTMQPITRPHSQSFNAPQYTNAFIMIDALE